LFYHVCQSLQSSPIFAKIEAHIFLGFEHIILLLRCIVTVCSVHAQYAFKLHKPITSNK